jgi:hypothetical protein
MPASRSSIDVLPALGVAAAGRVGVGQLVDDHHTSGRRASIGVEVELGRGPGATGARQDLEPLQPISAAVSARPWCSTSPITTSRPASRGAAGRVEHRAGLADARRGPEPHLEAAARRGVGGARRGQQPVGVGRSSDVMVSFAFHAQRLSSARFTRQHVHPRRPRAPAGPLGVLGDEPRTTSGRARGRRRSAAPAAGVRPG